MILYLIYLTFFNQNRKDREIMERNQLRYIIETAKYGNITHAAEALHITQPSLSNQIISLENELGIKLFERVKKRIYLTEAGTAFTRSALQILNDMDTLQQMMKDFSNVKAGRIRLGLPPNAAHIGIMDIIQSFSEQYPAVNLVFTESGSNNLLTKLKEKDLDAAVVLVPQEFKDENIHHIKLMQSEIVAVIHCSSPLAEKKSIRLNEMQNQKFILTGEDFYLQRIILNAMDLYEIPYQISASCSQIESCFDLANRNLGITFCSRQASAFYSRYANLRYIPVENIGPRVIQLVYINPLEYHPALNAFVTFITKAFPE